MRSKNKSSKNDESYRFAFTLFLFLSRLSLLIYLSSHLHLSSHLTLSISTALSFSLHSSLISLFSMTVAMCDIVDAACYCVLLCGVGCCCGCVVLCPVGRRWCVCVYGCRFFSLFSHYKQRCVYFQTDPVCVPSQRPRLQTVSLSVTLFRRSSFLLSVSPRLSFSSQ